MNAVNRILFFSCKKATELVEKREVVTLGHVNQFRLQTHLNMCNTCRMYAAFSKQLDAFYAQESAKNTPLKASNEFKMRVLATIKK